jgi:hypothetical protein
MLIDTAEFIREMDHHWTKRLQNVSSHNLRRVWKQIGDKFNEHITNHGKPGAGTKWTVLQPPTGSGKRKGRRSTVPCSLDSHESLTLAY